MTPRIIGSPIIAAFMFLAACGGTGNQYGAASYPLTINNTLSWCTVTATVGGVQLTDFSSDSATIQVAAGATVNLTAVPVNAGFGPAIWTGTTTANDAQATYVMTATANQNVTADCPIVYILTLANAASAACTVSATPAGGAAENLGATPLIFDAGVVVTLSATPFSDSYTFEYWTGTDVSGNNPASPATVTMNADNSVTVVCPAVTTYPLTINNQGASCDIVASVGGTVKTTLDSANVSKVIDLAPGVTVDFVASPNADRLRKNA